MITAEGRTHPVTTYFLEDVYENLDYCLASDSPVSINYGSFSAAKVYLLMVSFPPFLLNTIRSLTLSLLFTAFLFPIIS